MPLESNPQTIADFDATWPIDGDSTTEGDNHLRNLKRVLQTIFPDGGNGIGFDAPVLATVVELNYLQGLTSNAQAQLDALGSGVSAGKEFLSAPDGAVLQWFQQTLPDGWIDPAGVFSPIYIAAGPIANAGTLTGTQSAGRWSHSHQVQPFALGSEHLPPHNHRIVAGGASSSNIDRNDGGSAAAFGDAVTTSPADTGNTESTGGGQPINGAITYESTFDPYIYHGVLIQRDVSLD